MANHPHPDRKVLARTGAEVRDRLAGDPAVWRFPEERAEVYVVDDFLPASSCRYLMRLIDDVACPSCVIDGKDWPDYRTSYSGDLDVRDRCVSDLERRISAVTGIASERVEWAQGQRYRRGEFFGEHCDWFDTASTYWQHERRCGGQRSWTAMIYLNAVEEGGTTEFTRVTLSVPPRAGALLLWNNALPDGTPNPWTMHAARPVLRGVKYVVTKWFRARPCQ